MKREYSKVRVGVVLILTACAFVVFGLRLTYIQVVRGAEWRNIARRQFVESIEVPAVRGEILDTRGNRIVANEMRQSIFAYPLNENDVKETYRRLALIFGYSQKTVRKKFNLKPCGFTWIKRGLNQTEMAKFEKHISKCGLFIREEPNRFYPYGRSGQAIIGFVDPDNIGKSGIELVMDDRLKGVNGRYLYQKNGRGGQYQIREIPLKEATTGESIVLTIDWDKQQIVEQELIRAVKKFKAKGGMAIFLDPHTGEILAASDYSTDADPESFPMKMKSVSDLFEPGSIFKLITAAAIFEDGSISESDQFYAEHGRWRLGRRTLRDDHEYDTLTFREGFELSSNIVMGKAAGQIGGKKVLAMAKKFGFGRKTRCGMHGEGRGVVKAPRRWSEFTTSTFAIGHGLSVTPLQMAQAFGIIAASGYLNQPHIIKCCITSDGRIAERHRSHPIKVLDEDVVVLLKSFLRGVVTRGTATMLADAPFPIAGKTGTAEKPNLENGGYHKNKFMASFAGYFPADSPLVAGIVILDEPEPIHYGGLTAGPAFENIAVKFAALDNYGQFASHDQTESNSETDHDPGLKANAAPIAVATPESTEKLIVPDLTGLSRVEAATMAGRSNWKIKFSGEGQEVFYTRPRRGTEMSPDDLVECVMVLAIDSLYQAPDLRGLTIREAASLLHGKGIAFTCRGKGRVAEQSPRAGTVLKHNQSIKLTFKRESGV